MNPETRKQMITKKAQELYQKGGCKPGRELDDWLAAEKIVDRELKAPKAMPHFKPGGNRQ